MSRSVSVLTGLVAALVVAAPAHAAAPSVAVRDPAMVSHDVAGQLVGTGDGGGWLLVRDATRPPWLRLVRLAAGGRPKPARTVAALRAGDAIVEARLAARGGRALVAWVQWPARGSARVRAATCTARRCGAARTVARGAALLGDVVPVLTRDGAAHVLFDDGAALRWATARHGRFGRPRVIAGGAQAQLRSPHADAVADARGGALVAWTTSARNRAIRVAHVASDGTVRPAMAAAGSCPHLAGAGAETVLAWQQGDCDGDLGEAPGGTVMAAVRAARAARFGPPQTVFAGPPDYGTGGRALSLAAGPDGRAALAFAATAVDSTDAPQSLMAAVRAPGGTFGAPVELDDGLDIDDTPSAAIGSDGRAVVGWRSSGRPGEALVATAPPSGDFRPATDLGSLVWPTYDDAGRAGPRSPLLALAGRHVIAAWPAVDAWVTEVVG